MRGSWFWQTFWPNLVSTALGVALGVPAALWINNKATESGERREQAQESRRLPQALETLDRSLILNTKKFVRLLSILRESGYLSIWLWTVPHGTL